jgi:hypothetical protein
MPQCLPHAPHSQQLCTAGDTGRAPQWLSCPWMIPQLESWARTHKVHVLSRDVAGETPDAGFASDRRFFLPIDASREIGSCCPNLTRSASLNVRGMPGISGFQSIQHWVRDFLSCQCCGYAAAVPLLRQRKEPKTTTAERTGEVEFTSHQVHVWAHG